MKNEIYEADYTREPDPDNGLGILELARDTGFFRAYDDLLRSMPKYIVPEDKKNYEELLPKLDALAKRKGGRIKGVVSYEHWDAHIYITLRHFEFVHKDDLELLKDLQEKAHSLTFTPTEEGEIQLSVMINYFEEIGDKDGVFSQAIEGNDELIGVLVESIERRKQSILEHPVLSYEHWDAHIYITLPFFEFVHKDEMELLNDLKTKAHSLTFTVTDDGKIQLSVMINYFEEIGDKEAVFSQAIEGNDELIEALTANIKQRKQKIVEHPVMGKVIETAARNLGISAKDYIDRVFEDDYDPELQMQFIAALLETKDDLLDDNE